MSSNPISSHVLSIQVALFLLCVTVFFIAAFLNKQANTLKEYVLGRGEIGTGVLILSFLGTFIGKGDLNQPYEIAQKGLVHGLGVGAFLCTLLFFSIWLAPKMNRFKEAVTTGDIMETLYGAHVRLFTAASTILSSLLILNVQCHTLNQVVAYFFDLTSYQHILYLLIGLSVICYTLIGGIRVVAVTNAIQCMAFTASLLVLCKLLLQTSGGIGGLVEKNSFFEAAIFLKKTDTWPHRIASIGFWSIYPAHLLMPPTIQRLLIAGKPKKIQNLFIGSAVLYAVLQVVLILMGLHIRQIGNVQGNPYTLGLLKTHGLVYLIKNTVIEQPILQSFLLIGLICVLLSTIDACLLCSGVILYKDILRPLLPKNKLLTNDVVSSQLCVGFLGGIMLGFPHRSHAMLSYLTGYYAILSFALFLTPFLLGLSGIKTSSNNFWSYAISYLGSFLSIKGLERAALLPKIINPYLCFFIAQAVGISAFYLSHYRRHRQFKWIKRSPKLFFEEQWQIPWCSIERWGRLFFYPTYWAAIARQKVATHGKEPLMFGLFSFFSYVILILYDTNSPLGRLSLLYGIGCLLCVGLIVEQSWPPRLKNYFDLYWFFTVGYCMPFTALSFFLTHPNNLPELAYLLIAWLLLLVVIDWESSLFIGFLGSLLAWATHQLTGREWSIALKGPGQGLFLFGILPTMLASLLFSRKREKQGIKQRRYIHMRYRDTQRQLKITQANHTQLAESLGQRSTIMQSIYRIIQKMENDRYNPAYTDRLKSAIKHLTHLRQNALGFLPLHIVPHKITAVLSESLNELKEDVLFKKYTLHLENLTTNQHIYGDRYYLKQLIKNSLFLTTQALKEGSDLYAMLRAVSLDYELSDLSAVPSVEITFSTQPITQGVKKTYTLQDNFFLGSRSDKWHANERIIFAHYGITQFLRKEQQFIQHYIIPYNLEKIRPKHPCFSDEEFLSRVRIDQPEDHAFLEKIRNHPFLDTERFKTALRLIKHYHRKQTRKSGEAFYKHPLAVASLLLNHTRQEEVLLAGLLHDLLEDTVCTVYQIEALFGREVAHIVQQVSNLYSKSARKIKMKKIKRLGRLATGNNHAASLVKLMDRLHNMQTLNGHTRFQKKQAIAKETRTLFIPLAEALGLPQVADQLEKLLHASEKNTP